MSTPRVTDLTLESYRLGELPAAEIEVVRFALGRDGALRARLASLDRSDDDLFRAHPVKPFVLGVQRRLAASPAVEPDGSRFSWWPFQGALAAALIALILIGAPARTPRVTPPAATDPLSPGDRLKGDGPDLAMFVQRGDGVVEPLSPGAVSRAGDVVQMAYRSGNGAYGVIVSVDGAGKVTRHFPLTGDMASPLRRGATTPLNMAYRLDDAPRAERFYFVTSAQPFPVEEVLSAARARGVDPLTLDRLSLGSAFSQSSFLLRKE